MNKALAIVVTLVVLGFGSNARADGSATASSKPPTYTTPVVDIIGRRAAPIAAIEVARAVPTIKLHALESPFVARIEASIHGDSF